MITLREMADLSTLYGQKHRHYHDIIHIQNCLAELDAYNQATHELSISDYEIAKTAIWYHDAVYNPYGQPGNNELESTWLVPEHHENYDSIRQVILMTAKHLKDIDWQWSYFDNVSGKVNPAQVTLDIDLAGFGKPTPEFLRNSANIRKEYYNTSDYDFAVGRLKFAEAISKRDYLYYTDYFRDKYHEMSRKNLQIEIEQARQTIDDLSGM